MSNCVLPHRPLHSCFLVECYLHMVMENGSNKASSRPWPWPVPVFPLPSRMVGWVLDGGPHEA